MLGVAQGPSTAPRAPLPDLSAVVPCGGAEETWDQEASAGELRLLPSSEEDALERGEETLEASPRNTTCYHGDGRSPSVSTPQQRGLARPSTQRGVRGPLAGPPLLEGWPPWITSHMGWA